MNEERILNQCQEIEAQISTALAGLERLQSTIQAPMLRRALGEDEPPQRVRDQIANVALAISHVRYAYPHLGNIVNLIANGAAPYVNEESQADPVIHARAVLEPVSAQGEVTDGDRETLKKIFEMGGGA